MTKMYQWQMVAENEPFVLRETSVPDTGKDEALVKVAACGVCHTDISFWHHSVKTKHSLPLTLGHEISGTVLKGPGDLAGKPVIVPAVLPCGECALCRGGRSNICRSQRMPGNDFHGGFASHVVVPARFLCPVPPDLLEKHAPEELAVIADAVSTPYQVVQKSGLAADGLAIVIGVGGIGIYGALIAKARGARVIAIDISAEKLALAKALGISHIVNSSGLGAREVKQAVKEMCREMKANDWGWNIYEFSGTKGGQELAFSLVTYASTLSVVGFTMDKVEVRLSNLMAFDASVIGTWGCRAELYPEVLQQVAGGGLHLSHLVETIPMSQINDVFQNVLAGKYVKRPVLVPDFDTRSHA